MDSSDKKVGWDKPPPYSYQRLAQDEQPMCPSTYTPAPATMPPPQHTSFSNNVRPLTLVSYWCSRLQFGEGEIFGSTY